MNKENWHILSDIVDYLGINAEVIEECTKDIQWGDGSYTQFFTLIADHLSAKFPRQKYWAQSILDQIHEMDVQEYIEEQSLCYWDLNGVGWDVLRWKEGANDPN